MTATVGFILLILSLVTQIVHLFLTSRDRISSWLHLLAALLLFLTIGIRSAKIKFFALTNTFESLLFFSGVLALILFLYAVRTKERKIPFVTFGGTVVAIVLLAVASSPGLNRTSLPPIPALRSHWLILHVSFSFVGEAFFAVAFAASVYYLVTSDGERRRRTDRVIYTSVGIGYPIFTAGALIFGAVWAQHAWGAYWSWDPKETWALITWLVYTGYLHTRLVKKTHGDLSAVLCIVGFLFTMFAFFGVNYLMSGLHSYG
jgi:ABC-type transport system involved in cytochrome c biogenesis permease subunit